jgi:hypothetical protein
MRESVASSCRYVRRARYRKTVGHAKEREWGKGGEEASEAEKEGETAM